MVDPITAALNWEDLELRRRVPKHDIFELEVINMLLDSVSTVNLETRGKPKTEMDKTLHIVNLSSGCIRFGQVVFS